MRFGCCLNMVAGGEDGTGAEKIPALVEAGYDYAELPAAQMMELSDKEFEQIIKTLSECGVKCETSNNLFPTYFRLTGSDVDMNRILDYAERAFSRLERLGAEFVVFGSGPAKSVPDGFSMEEGYKQLVELTKKLAEIAEKHSITIVIEPLRKQESNLINTFAEGVTLAKDVDHPAVKVLVDYYHLVEENEPVENLEKWGKEYLRHIHFARQSGRNYPTDLKEDEKRYKEFFEALEKIGYSSRISVEAYTDDFSADAPKALSVLKGLSL